MAESTRHQAKRWGIVGNESIIDILRNSVTHDGRTHAYCFSGPEGVGKATVARRYAAALLCEKRNGDPCGTCASCRATAHGAHPDLTCIGRDNGKSISIDVVRSRIVSRLSQTAVGAAPKIAIIDDAHALTPEAANALLKTLEEPAGSSVIILVTRRAEWLPRTIVSRCTVMRFGLINHDTMSRFVQSLGVSKNEQEAIIHIARGRPALAAWMAHDRTALAAEKEACTATLDLFLQPLHERMRQAELLIDAKGDNAMGATEDLLRRWTIVARDAILVSSGMREQLVHRHAVTAIQKALRTISIQQWRAVLESIERGAELLRCNVPPRTVIESVLLTLP